MLRFSFNAMSPGQENENSFFVTYEPNPLLDLCVYDIFVYANEEEADRKPSTVDGTFDPRRYLPFVGTRVGYTCGPGASFDLGNGVLEDYLETECMKSTLNHLFEPYYRTLPPCVCKFG